MSRLGADRASLTGSCSPGRRRSPRRSPRRSQRSCSGRLRPASTGPRTRISARSCCSTASRSGTTSGTRAGTRSSPTACCTTRSLRCSESGFSPSPRSRPQPSRSASSCFASGGSPSRLSSRSFAVLWVGIVGAAAFPFALAISFALLSLWALQGGRRGRFALCAVLTLAASPLAFAFLVARAGRRRPRAAPSLRDARVQIAAVGRVHRS